MQFSIKLIKKCTDSIDITHSLGILIYLCLVIFLRSFVIESENGVLVLHVKDGFVSFVLLQLRPLILCKLGVFLPLVDCEYPAWGRGTPFPPLLLPCPFTSSSVALYYLYPFSFSHSLHLFSSIVLQIPFYHNRPTPFPGVRS